MTYDLKVLTETITDGTVEEDTPGSRHLIRGSCGGINYVRSKAINLKVGDFFCTYRKFLTMVDPPIYFVKEEANTDGKIVGMYLQDIANQINTYGEAMTDASVNFANYEDITRYTPTQRDRALAATYLATH